MRPAAIKAVRELGALFSSNTGRVLGQDGCYSIPLPDGRSFWTFGDTIIGPGRVGYDPAVQGIDSWMKEPWAKANAEMISNSGGFTKGRIEDLLQDIRYIGGKEAVEILPPDRERKHSGNRYRPFWPMDGICVDGLLYLYYIMVDCAMAPKPGEIDINVYGSGVAVAAPPYLSFERLEPGDGVTVPVPRDADNSPEHRYMFWNTERGPEGDPVCDFGTAMLNEPVDGMVYVYGSRVSVEGEWICNDTCVARVPKGSLGTASAYRYFDGSGWNPDPRSSKPVFTGNANELSVSYNQYLGCYTAFYSFGGDRRRMGDAVPGMMEKLCFRTAGSPEGPWSDAVPFHAMRRSAPFDYCYAGKEHPEFAKEGGRITYVTYISHQRYFPDLVEVEFE